MVVKRLIYGSVYSFYGYMWTATDSGTEFIFFPPQNKIASTSKPGNKCTGILVYILLNALMKSGERYRKSWAVACPA